MEKPPSYIVEITPEAENYFLDLLFYLYQTHSEKSADRKSQEILDLAISLNSNPKRGKIEEDLLYLGKEHRFLVYAITSRKTVKVIYFVNDEKKIVYVTDFFPAELNPNKIQTRQK